MATGNDGHPVAFLLKSSCSSSRELAGNITRFSKAFAPYGFLTWNSIRLTDAGSNSIYASKHTKN